MGGNILDAKMVDEQINKDLELLLYMYGRDQIGRLGESRICEELMDRQRGNQVANIMSNQRVARKRNQMSQR